MEQRPEIRDFLATRRAKITPDQVGLPTSGRRRVPGLRREEVAVLAGVSTEWYTRLEKGHVAGVSDEVIAAVARALRLDHDERTYLFDLARAARTTRRPPARVPGRDVAPHVQWLLDSMTLSAAFVTDQHADVVAANALGRAVHAPMFASPTVRERPNFARFTFLDPRAREFCVDWDGVARHTTLCLRAAAGRDPEHPGLQELVGELSTLSPEFRTLWATHDVRMPHGVVKTLRNPEVGDLELSYQSLPLPGTGPAGHELYVYTAEPHSPTEDGMRLLASLTATAGSTTN